MSLKYEPVSEPLHSSTPNPKPYTLNQVARVACDDDAAELLVLWPRCLFLKNATVRGRAWYKLLDTPVPTLDVTV